MRIVAVIPARGGSKGIPRKNIASLGGKPLIAWSIQAAIASQSFGRVIVSTDDEEIAAVARHHGAEVPFLRPHNISDDGAPALGVIRHAIQQLSMSGDRAVDAIAYLQPTSPFRSAKQIVEAVELYRMQKPDTLVSMVRVPHNMAPASLMRLAATGGNRLEMEKLQILRRQDKEQGYARNGPAILIVSTAHILQDENLYSGNVIGYEMDAITSVDIDEPIDLAVANCLLPLVAGASRDTS